MPDWFKVVLPALLMSVLGGIGVYVAIQTELAKQEVRISTLEKAVDDGILPRAVAQLAEIRGEQAARDAGLKGEIRLLKFTMEAGFKRLNDQIDWLKDRVPPDDHP